MIDTPLQPNYLREDYFIFRDADDQQRNLSFFHFGDKNAEKKAYIHAGLHADEFPGMLALHYLNRLLADAAHRGRINGHIVIVPQANPIGLTQWKDGFLLGRFDHKTGVNFNRQYPDLFALIAQDIEPKLTDSKEENTKIIRQAMLNALNKINASTPVDLMRLLIMKEACNADLVLDLHADNEAQCHMYTLTALWPTLADVAAEIDARAVLLADEAGGNPFDEACAAPWEKLQQHFSAYPIDLACHSATLELGSNDEVDVELAQKQANALFRVLVRRGFIKYVNVGRLPTLSCEGTLLEAMQQLRAPCDGLIVYHRRLGDHVREGDLLVSIVDPLAETMEIKARTSGIFFARHNQTYAYKNKVIGKVSGKEPLPERSGNLLSE